MEGTKLSILVEIFLWIDLGLSLRFGLSGGVVYSMLLHDEFIRYFAIHCSSRLLCSQAKASSIAD
jgi:hypothetical protein